MIIKKLHARFINDKILKDAEQCYIATTGITDEGFEFVVSRLPKACKVYIVTGLNTPTEPALLRKILTQYYGRVSLAIYTRNIFDAGAYIFDMPYRKRIAFIGSANFTLEGLQHNEELSYRTEIEKEVEEAKTWFTAYFEDAVPLSEKIIRAYESIYPSIIERENVLKEEKKRFSELIINELMGES